MINFMEKEIPELNSMEYERKENFIKSLITTSKRKGEKFGTIGEDPKSLMILKKG